MSTCVCGHVWLSHDPWLPGACDLCECVAYLDRHLPGQVMLGDGDDALPVDNR